MTREFSAGGVVLHQIKGRWHVAVIEPRGKESSAGKKGILALPKGLMDRGETPVEAARREILEETGVKAVPVTKLGDVKYVYIRSFSDGERVFKIVSFFLFKYVSGNIGDIAPEMRNEVSRALWLPLDEAITKLSYRGEREMAAKALEYTQSHPELTSPIASQS